MEKTALFDGIKFQRSPRRGLVRDLLVVTQELGGLQSEIFMAKNFYSMGDCKPINLLQINTEPGTN